MKRLLLLATALLSGCLSLSFVWFNPVPLDAYDVAEFSTVPDELVEFVAFPGTAVEDEDEAPTLWGVWLHQCTDLDDEATCDPHTDHPEFEAPRRDRTLLYFHGNGGNLEHYWDRATILWRMGFRVFAVDYRGYGASTGAPSEDGVFADARSANLLVRERMAEEAGLSGDEPPPAAAFRIGYYGWSLGSTAAIDLSTFDPPAALVTESALASAQAFLDDAIGVGIARPVIYDTKFDNLGKIGAIASPKLLAHGTDDTFVKFGFSELLFDEAEEPKVLFPVPGADHGNVPCPTRDPSVPSTEAPCVATDSYLDTVGSFYDEWLLGS